MTETCRVYRVASLESQESKRMNRYSEREGDAMYVSFCVGDSEREEGEPDRSGE